MDKINPPSNIFLCYAVRRLSCNHFRVGCDIIDSDIRKTGNLVLYLLIWVFSFVFDNEYYEYYEIFWI